MQDQLNAHELLLMTHSEVYFEFIPMDEFDGVDSKHVIALENVKTGTEYALVISTSAGLWRYIIGDTLRFTQTHPYRFIVTGRTTQFLNSFGEKVLIQQVENTIEKVNRAMRFRVTDFTIAPYFNKNEAVGGHEWFIEFDQAPDDIIAFEKAIDEQLKVENADYEAKRFLDLNIGKPKFHYLAKVHFINGLLIVKNSEVSIKFRD